MVRCHSFCKGSIFTNKIRILKGRGPKALRGPFPPFHYSKMVLSSKKRASPIRFKICWHTKFRCPNPKKSKQLLLLTNYPAKVFFMEQYASILWPRQCLALSNVATRGQHSMCLVYNRSFKSVLRFYSLDFC